MNRLEHIKITLPKNLENCLSLKKNIEYVLLDYSSQDGLEEWVKQNLSAYIESGLLIYYKINDKTLFDRSHSRNLAFKLAKGDILCNVDADNFIGEGFAEYLIEEFKKDQKIFITPSDGRDVLGRLCIARKVFLKLRGYDESMRGYGFEDLELYRRLINNSFKQLLIVKKEHLKFIAHNNSYRYGNEFHGQNITEVYLHYIEPWETEVIFLYKTKEIHIVKLINSEILYSKQVPEFVLREQKGSKEISNTVNYENSDTWNQATWIIGNWNMIDGLYEIKFPEEESFNLYQYKPNVLKKDKDGSYFYKIVNPDFSSSLILMRSEMGNRKIMNTREANKFETVNQNGFGKGTVKKNFQNDQLTII